MLTTSCHLDECDNFTMDDVEFMIKYLEDGIMKDRSGRFFLNNQTKLQSLANTINTKAQDVYEVENA